ncbi:NAD-dependent aldehyde dehydrogenase [Rhodofomes roseus]|uniref:Aldehyde dehydrogenase n=1 Tax=Rhodofomes roseus TaxID=34475 RepID=A0ABQ8KQV1_9APHY|nr:NAD-dependent aldehyde dehydrogenase [Rhodofomes roseus]KAH9840961.1 NAD-dependent aldehyde dehydrogenase [Rhodofomes roseus]
MTDTLRYTPVEDIPKIRHELGLAFNSGRTRSIAYRKQQLSRLFYLVEDNQERIRQAIFSDLGRPRHEVDFLEISGTLLEIRDAYDNVEKWAAPQKSPFSLLWFTLSPATRKEPKGVVLIISPFNYPYFLTLTPLAAAIAAGNAAMLKPSELCPASASLLAELIPKYLDPELVRVVNGGVPETTKILELRFNHILYTGNNRVAQIICTAAAKHLTPVTLELGGKSPCVVDPKCNVKIATKRIWWGRLVNCGQVCLCPDYILVPESFQDEFVEALKDAYNELHPTDPKTSGMLGRIVNERHVERLQNLLDNTKGTIVFGGEIDKEARYVAPTLIRDVKADDSLMSEEIFGPLLPVVPVKDLDEAITFINSVDEALSVYIFTSDSKFKNKVIDNTRSGTAAANDTILHVMGPSYMHAKWIQSSLCS